MRATPIATPITIPATVPLGSLLGDGGADVVAGACEAELLLVEVLWLVLGLVFELMLGLALLGFEAIGVELSPGTSPVLGVTEGVEEAVVLLTEGVEVVIIGELVAETGTPV